MNTAEYRLVPRPGARLTTAALYAIASHAGWRLAQAPNDVGATADEQHHLIADTYTGEAHFHKTGKDNWSRIVVPLVFGDEDAAICEQIVEWGLNFKYIDRRAS